tara:strand:- start:161 stop:898 length:738 start_codon:yes stop_codon:yes gene_type:complete
MKSGWNINSDQTQLFTSGKVCLYARVSTQRKEADTIDTQLEELNRWASEASLQVLGTFWDRCSGRKGAEVRDGLRMAIETANKTGASVVCVELSRLSRSVRDTADMLDAGTQFVFTRDGVQMSKEMLLVKSLFAQMEAEATSRRVKAGIDNKFKSDPNARLEWGVARHRDTTIQTMTSARISKATEHTLKVGKVAFEMRERGETLQSIADTYGEMGVLTSRGKAKWSSKTIRALVSRYKALTMEK